VTGLTEAEIFRINVAYAKMMFHAPKLEEYRVWFASQGVPEKPSCIEQAALELLGMV
jgi:hypothetical protein